jgi:protein-tyrosine phosphatase
MNGGELGVLVVCHGNISRSAAGEHLLRASVGQRFRVSSAGIGAHMVAGKGVDRVTRALLGKRGIDASRHSAQQLHSGLIAGAELILTMNLEQRSWVSGEAPLALQRTFTLREFARLATAVRSQRPQSVTDMIRRAATSRAVYPVAAGGTDEIADPHGGSIDDYKAAFSAVERSVEVVAAELMRYERLRTAAPSQPFAGFVL